MNSFSDNWKKQILSDFASWLDELPSHRVQTDSVSKKHSLADFRAEFAALKTEISWQNRETKKANNQLEYIVKDSNRSQAEVLRYLEMIGRRVAVLEKKSHRTPRPSASQGQSSEVLVVRSFLGIRDSLERTLALANRHVEEANKAGISDQLVGSGMADTLKVIVKRFDLILEEHGYQYVPTLGQSFDPRIMNAVGTVSLPAHQDGEVVEEVCGCYLFKEQVYQVAQVTVNVAADDTAALEPEQTGADGAAAAGEDAAEPRAETRESEPLAEREAASEGADLAGGADGPAGSGEGEGLVGGNEAGAEGRLEAVRDVGGDAGAVSGAPLEGETADAGRLGGPDTEAAKSGRVDDAGAPAAGAEGAADRRPTFVRRMLSAFSRGTEQERESPRTAGRGGVGDVLRLAGEAADGGEEPAKPEMGQLADAGASDDGSRPVDDRCASESECGREIGPRSADQAGEELAADARDLGARSDGEGSSAEPSVAGEADGGEAAAGDDPAALAGLRPKTESFGDGSGPAGGDLAVGEGTESERRAGRAKREGPGVAPTGGRESAGLAGEDSGLVESAPKPDRSELAEPASEELFVTTEAASTAVELPAGAEGPQASARQSVEPGDEWEGESRQEGDGRNAASSGQRRAADEFNDTDRTGGEASVVAPSGLAELTGREAASKGPPAELADAESRGDADRRPVVEARVAAGWVAAGQAADQENPVAASATPGDALADDGERAEQAGVNSTERGAEDSESEAGPVVEESRLAPSAGPEAASASAAERPSEPIPVAPRCSEPREREGVPGGGAAEGAGDGVAWASEAASGAAVAVGRSSVAELAVKPTAGCSEREDGCASGLSPTRGSRPQQPGRQPDQGEEPSGSGERGGRELSES